MSDEGDWAARFTQTMLKPLADVGRLLAGAIDQQAAEIAEFRNDLRALRKRIERLEQQ